MAETFTHEFRVAILWVWIVLSVLVACILVAPFLLPHELIAQAVPICEAKARGGECFLCGMTTAFLLISAGRPMEALDANRGSWALYSVLVLNELLLLWMMFTAKGGRVCRC